MGFTYSGKTFGGGVGSGPTVVSTLAILGSQSKTITDNVSTPFATIAIADGETYAGELIYSVISVDGTALQRLMGRARWSATREGAVYTASITDVGVQTLAAAASTLTGSIAMSGAAGAFTFAATFNSGQATPVMELKYRFDSPDSALSITPL